MEVRAYLRWKHDQVVAALRSRGLDPEVDEISLAFGRQDGARAWLSPAHPHELNDVEVCPVLSSRIVAALPKLRKALAPLVREWREAQGKHHRNR
jgi:tRNA/tmRNA/rRNA uracil-C5-methylase (TrmA/RlmC/RlmD family)